MLPPGATTPTATDVNLTGNKSVGGGLTSESRVLVIVFCLIGVLVLAGVAVVLLLRRRRYCNRQKRTITFVEEYDFEDTSLRSHPPLGEPDTDMYMFGGIRLGILGHASNPVAVDADAAMSKDRILVPPFRVAEQLPTAASSATATTHPSPYAASEGPVWLNAAAHRRRPVWVDKADTELNHLRGQPIASSLPTLEQHLGQLIADGTFAKCMFVGRHHPTRCAKDGCV